MGLWNLFPDPIDAPRVQLAATVSTVEGVNCRAVPDGSAVALTDIPAYGFAFFEAEVL